MPIPADKRKSYLAKQVGTLALSSVAIGNPMSVTRAAAWHNILAGMGIYLPLFAVHDLGILLTAPRGAGGWSLAARSDVLARLNVTTEQQAALGKYRELLKWISESEVIEKAASWRLRDELIGILVLRIFGDVYHRWPYRAKATGASTLPLDPELYGGADVAAHYRDFDARPLWDFLEHLTRHSWHVYTCVEQVDLDTLRLLGLFSDKNATRDRDGGEIVGGTLELPDLFVALRSPEANDVVNFSLELLPSVLETKRASGAQTFSMDGYASLERRGNLDSLVLSEFAYPEDLFDRKVVDQELYYYGHEMEREEERRLQYILVDSSASMRGQRQVFARGLALTLAKKLSLAGDEVWLRFFDSRLYDTVKVARSGSFSVPYMLSFRSERGRNYGKVFRQVILDLTRMKREARRRIVLYVITHGQCHIPVELVAALKNLAYLYGVIILPSSEVALDYLPLFDRHYVVSAEALASREGRKDRALHILSDQDQEDQREKKRGN
jgi:hypothetical protein